MSANLGRARAIASSFVILAAVIVVSSAEGQSPERARALAVDSALRTYRLPSLAESGARTVLPWLALPKRQIADTPRFVSVQTVAPRTPEPARECAMPVARDPNRSLADSSIVAMPGSPVPMPTRRYACENPLR